METVRATMEEIKEFIDVYQTEVVWPCNMMRKIVSSYETEEETILQKANEIIDFIDNFVEQANEVLAMVSTIKCEEDITAEFEKDLKKIFDPDKEDEIEEKMGNMFEEFNELTDGYLYNKCNKYQDEYDEMLTNEEEVA